MLVVLLLLPLSSAMGNGEFDHVVLVEAVATWRQWQRRRWWWWAMICSKSGRQQEY
jgi:hypothetical protein